MFLLVTRYQLILSFQSKKIIAVTKELVFYFLPPHSWALFRYLTTKVSFIFTPLFFFSPLIRTFSLKRLCLVFDCLQRQKLDSCLSDNQRLNKAFSHLRSLDKTWSSSLDSFQPRRSPSDLQRRNQWLFSGCQKSSRGQSLSGGKIWLRCSGCGSLFCPKCSSFSRNWPFPWSSYSFTWFQKCLWF